MEFDCSIREIPKEETEEALSLVWRVFQEYEAPDYAEQGIDEFYKSIHEEGYLSRLCWYGAFVQEKLGRGYCGKERGDAYRPVFCRGIISRTGDWGTAVSGCPEGEPF